MGMNRDTLFVMAFRFIHTGYWQIGKVFRYVDSAAMGGLLISDNYFCR